MSVKLDLKFLPLTNEGFHWDWSSQVQVETWPYQELIWKGSKGVKCPEATKHAGFLTPVLWEREKTFPFSFFAWCFHHTCRGRRARGKTFGRHPALHMKMSPCGTCFQMKTSWNHWWQDRVTAGWAWAQQVGVSSCAGLWMGSATGTGTKPNTPCYSSRG